MDDATDNVLGTYVCSRCGGRKIAAASHCGMPCALGTLQQDVGLPHRPLTEPPRALPTLTLGALAAAAANPRFDQQTAIAAANAELAAAEAAAAAAEAAAQTAAELEAAAAAAAAEAAHLMAEAQEAAEAAAAAERAEAAERAAMGEEPYDCLLYTSPSPRD